VNEQARGRIAEVKRRANTFYIHIEKWPDLEAYL
jgi:hypothetical protein